MLQFTKSLPYLPDLARPRPLITEQDKARAAAEPPWPVPFHCKPWVDGQTIGWTLVYGYRTAVTLRQSGEGGVIVENGEQLDEERGRSDTIALTEEGVRLETGYSLCTPAGLVALLIPANRPVAGLQLEVGWLETEGQYRPVSLVFGVSAGVAITLAAGVELARVVLIPRPESLGAARPLEGEALMALREREAAYRAEEQTTAARWTAATGDSFTHLYRMWSRRGAWSEE
jgi:hypothetical protein